MNRLSLTPTFARELVEERQFRYREVDPQLVEHYAEQIGPANSVVA